MSSPEEPHWQVALWAVCYIKKAQDRGILLSAKNSLYMQAYCVLTGPFVQQQGALLLVTALYSVLVCFLRELRSKSQFLSHNWSRIPCHGQHYEWTHLASVTTKRFGIPKHPALLRCDNYASLQIANSPVFHECTKHMEIDCHFVREKIHERKLHISFVPSDLELADIFTRSLLPQSFDNLTSKLMYHPWAWWRV